MSRIVAGSVPGLTTVRSVGSALPADVLTRVITGTELPSLSADSYKLELNLSPREAANRAWANLLPAWRAFRAAVDARPESDAAVGLTRDKWLGVLLRELGFGRLRPTPAGGLVADDRSFPISHCYDTGAEHDVPQHLLGWNVDLDKRSPGVPGAADKAPHAMVQEYLNRADTAMWAILSNGRTLRLLRDSSTLIGQSYVEFDLKTMFDGEVFSDFVVLFLVCHETRFTAILEQWRTFATESGTRALTALSPGVAKAIAALGTGFLRHPGNSLAGQLAAKEVRLDDVHHALLRLVYRLLFCFVTEDRGVLLDPDAPMVAKQRFDDWFSTARLRRVARRRVGTRHTDQWSALRLVLDGLGAEGGRPEIAIPGIGGLFTDGPVDRLLADQQLPNDSLFDAIRNLTIVQPIGGGPKRTIDYRNLGAEELGSVYESLLEYVPRFDPTQRAFTLENLAGNDRKTSGAYYTPSSLIDCLLDSALDPLLDEAEKAAEPAAALLALTVCDPACGSGHFLVAAARRIAARLAKARSADAEPTPTDEQRAMHDVVQHCIYGVDLNPLAAELAKVSLWLESVEPGRPLSFLSAHIKVGNSLLGTTPALLAHGIPDEAFTAIEGDDKKFVGELKKRNKLLRSGGQGQQGGLFDVSSVPVSNKALAARFAEVEAAPPKSLADLQLAEQRLAAAVRSDEFRKAAELANTWCAAFVATKKPGSPEITQETFDKAARGDLPFFDGTNFGFAGEDQAEVAALTAQYRFFHWHLEFPQIFTVPEHGPANTATGWTGGFSCVIGNPPWERIKLQEQEFFAALDADVAGAPNAAARKKMIAALAESAPELFASFKHAARRADGESAFLRLSGRYPLCGRGDINTYAIFAELNRALLSLVGRLGVILPTGIATDATTQHYFKDLVRTSSLASLFDFENARPLFAGVHRSFKFCLLTLSGSERPIPAAKFAFFLHHPDGLLADDAVFELTPEELTILNPNTGTCPIFRSRRDAEITLGIYRRVPILIREGDPNGNPWGLSFMTMFHMSNDSGLFRTRAELEGAGWRLSGNVFERDEARMLPLYEAKMIHHYDHRWATYEGDDIRDTTPEEHADPNFVVLPRYWVPESEVRGRLGGRWEKDWLLGFRDICRATDERTMICSVFPVSAVGNNLPIVLSKESHVHLLPSVMSSLVFDYVARLSVGGTHMNFFIAEQLPALTPLQLAGPAPWSPLVTTAEWIEHRAQGLTAVASDLSGWPGPTVSEKPVRFDGERRAVLRGELDACMFLLYGCSRPEAEYILDTFTGARNKDEKAFGEFRTKRLVLEAYDAMATGSYASPLDPPLGQHAEP